MVIAELSFGSRIDDDDDETVALFVPVVQAQHMAAALSIADLIHRQCLHWGVDHIPTSFLQPINAALAVVTNDLEPPEHRSAFIKLALGLHSLSKRSVSAESMLRMLRLTMRQKHLMTSGDMDKLFKDADQHWEDSLWVRLGAAAGPGPAFGSTTDNHHSELDTMHFLEAFSGGSLSIQQQSGGATPEESYALLIDKWNHFNMGGPSSSSSSSC